MPHEIGRDSKLSDSNCQEEDEAPRDWAELCHQLKELRSSMFINGAESIRAKIKAIVPQYSFQQKTAAKNDLIGTPSGTSLGKAAGHN
jgi:hypothetical protein